MRHTALLLLFSICVYICSSCGGSDRNDQLTSSSYHEDSTPNPEKIWKSKCISCHGLRGNLGANGAANLQEATSSLDYRVQIITNGKGVMTPWKDLLSEEEILAIAEYTLSFNPDFESNGK